MPKRWTKKEEKEKRDEMIELYVNKNKSIGEIANILDMSESGVYDRLNRLDIKSRRSEKPGFNNKRRDIKIPNKSIKLAEFIGIMLGDGGLTSTQIRVTLNSNEQNYANYISNLIKELFNVEPGYFIRKNKKALVIYLGSTDIVKWLKDMGMSQNKVKDQVDIPNWLYKQKDFLKYFVRGFFDTDGSVYKIKFGIQISFKNRSLNLLKSTKEILEKFNYNPSKISSNALYITRKNDLNRFFKDFQPKNKKHLNRYKKFANS